MADWATISSLATAAGTLILAVATFAAVRSAHRAARATERALMAGIRPVLVASRMEDPPEKVGFHDDHWVRVGGGRAVAEATDDAVYLAIALRNVGSGLAVLDRWDFYADRGRDEFPPREPERFRRLTRDIYVPAGDTGFWQGALRDPTDTLSSAARDAIAQRKIMTVDLLYGDLEGGQRPISRFALLPRDDGQWLCRRVTPLEPRPRRPPLILMHLASHGRWDELGSPGVGIRRLPTHVPEGRALGRLRRLVRAGLPVRGRRAGVLPPAMQHVMPELESLSIDISPIQRRRCRLVAELRRSATRLTLRKEPFISSPGRRSRRQYCATGSRSAVSTPFPGRRSNGRATSASR